MKTFLGVHYPSTGRRYGLGGFLNAGAAGICCFDCGFPIPVVNRIAAFIARVFGARVTSQKILASATSSWFYATRFTVDNDDNPPNFYTDPIGSARYWYAGLKPRWARNPGANCRIVNNELDTETPWHGAQQCTFNLEFMRLVDADGQGEHVGICSYAGGNPSDNQLLDGSPCTLEDRWRPMLPAVKYAGEHGHYVVLHIHQQDLGNMETPSGQQISLRHERSIAYWLDNAKHPECIITKPPRIVFNEVSNGVGGEEPNRTQWLTSVKWLDQHLRASPYNSLFTVLGLYQAGGAEAISEGGYNALATYISQQPEIVINPLPGDPAIPPPEPPPQPANATVIEITPPISVRVLNITPSTEVLATLLLPKGYVVTVDRVKGGYVIFDPKILEQK